MTTLIYQFHSRERENVIQSLCSADYATSCDNMDCSICLDSLLPEITGASLNGDKESDDLVLEDIEYPVEKVGAVSSTQGTNQGSDSGAGAKTSEVLPAESTAGVQAQSLDAGTASTVGPKDESLRVRLLTCGHLFHSSCVELWQVPHAHLQTDIIKR